MIAHDHRSQITDRKQSQTIAKKCCFHIIKTIAKLTVVMRFGQRNVKYTHACRLKSKQHHERGRAEIFAASKFTSSVCHEATSSSGFVGFDNDRMQFLCCKIWPLFPWPINKIYARFRPNRWPFCSCL